MKIKECFVTTNGISCINNFNNNILDNLKYNNIISNNIKNNIIFYLSLRIAEFILTDFLSNKHYFNNISKNDEFLLNSIIFN